ncbi:MAG: DUF1150 domain-containing protein [Rhizobiales bacterium]|nr:DUF1150 domain-containing protein [Hyphomicrobiales bacterium]
MTHDIPRDVPPFTPEQFAGLGGGSVAYVRAFERDEVRRLFPQAPETPPGVTIFALIAADGSPIMLTDSKDAAIANAWEHELETVSVH